MATFPFIRLRSWLHGVLPILAPTEWRINGAAGGLYVIEQNGERGWQLEGIVFSLAEAFAFAERLHGPVPARTSGPWATPALASRLPDRYRVCTESSWRGRVYQHALADNPFRAAAPRPRDALRLPAWRAARAGILAALARGDSVVLMGEAGTGKSRLLRDLAGEAPDALLIDDPAKVSPAALAALLDSGTPFVLAVCPGAGILDALPSSILVIALPALAPEGTARWILARFAASGRGGDAVEPEAILALTRHTGGRMRELEQLAGAAVFLADLESAGRVTFRHVEDAAALRAAPTFRHRAPGPAPFCPPRTRALLGATAAGVLLVLASGLTAYRLVVTPTPASHAAIAAPAALAEAGTPAPVAISAPSRAPAALPLPAVLAPKPELAAIAAPSVHATPPDLAAIPAPAEPEFEDGLAFADTTSPDLAESAPPPTELAGAFQGPVNNDTLDQSGRLALVISHADPTGTVRAKFRASDGLLGTGELAGRLTANGHISATGQLMMGRNPFNCSLDGWVENGRLIGSAEFVRPWGGRVFHSRFTLSRT